MKTNRRLALILLALAPVGALGQTPKKFATPKTIQTRTLARLAVALGESGVSLDAERRRSAAEALRYANQEISYVVGRKLNDLQKTRKIVALQDGAVASLQKTLPSATFASFRTTFLRLDERAVLERLKVLALGEGDDPFGGIYQLGVGDDPFGRAGRYIGETEKNFARTDALGGNALPARLVEASLGTEFRPARKR